MTEYICIVCGKPIQRRPGEYPSRWKRRKTCSKDCYAIAARTPPSPPPSQRHLPPDENGCMIWNGPLHRNGYGQASSCGDRLAHRAAYIEAFGSIPEGCDVHHRCGVAACVNPAHLEALTRDQHRQKTAAPWGTSAYRGVSRAQRDRKWRAAGSLGGITTVVGYFDTEDEARKAASDWRRENMPYSEEAVA